MVSWLPQIQASRLSSKDEKGRDGPNKISSPLSESSLADFPCSSLPLKWEMARNKEETNNSSWVSEAIKAVPKM